MDHHSKPNIQLAVPFFGVADMEVSLRFYVEGLKFKVTKQWTPRGKIEWCWLERDAVSLMLQTARAVALPLSALATEPLSAPATPLPKSGPSINFQCADALALYHEFKDRGLAMSEPSVGNGDVGHCRQRPRWAIIWISKARQTSPKKPPMRNGSNKMWLANASGERPR